MDVVVFGASGYSGLEILRLLARHPAARVAAASSDTLANTAVRTRVVEWPTELAFEPHDAVLQKAKPDQIALLATPLKTSVDLTKSLLDRGLRVIDLSGAHRLDDVSLYPEWYGFQHPHPELCAIAEYGLVEIFPPKPGARLIANPGCYATAAVLAAAPLLASGLCGSEAPIIVDGKSGATGAGRTLDEKLLFGEVAESVRPYRLLRHQHTPEIERALSRIAKRTVKVSFTAHLVPMRRGLVTSVYVTAKPGAKTSDVEAAFRAYYRDETFVRTLSDRPPESGLVSHTNYAEVSAVVDPRTGVVEAFCAIDNLVKGAAGQAIQNLNAMMGIDLSTGLGGRR